jgi:hypothetical protein
MAYDPATATMVMYGGFNCVINSTQTWSWNGSTWTQLHPASTGPGRNSGVMTYDCATGQLTIFNRGGYESC